MDIREYFKELVSAAKNPKFSDSLISFGSQRASWFEKNGRYFYLTDKYIDECPIGLLKNEIIKFTYTCFQQR